MRLALALVLAVTTSAAAQAAGNVEKLTKLKPFQSLTVSGCFDVQLAQGVEPQLSISASEAQQAKIKVDQLGGKVEIKPSDDDVCDGNPEIAITVVSAFAKDDEVSLTVRGAGDLDATLPQVKTITLSISGAGDLTLKQAAGTTAASCRLEISGAGDIEAKDLACASAEISVRGSGEAELAGKTQKCLLEVRGSGDVDASRLACDAAKVDVSGSGNVVLAKIEELEVAIRGSGNVSYKGEPKLKSAEIRGSGKLRKL